MARYLHNPQHLLIGEKFQNVSPASEQHGNGKLF